MNDGPVRIKTRVFLEGKDDPLDAYVDNRDFVRWDETAKREGWGDATEAKFLFQTFCAWSALQRNQKLDGMDFATFKRLAWSIGEVETEPIVPFDKEAGSDSP